MLSFEPFRRTLNAVSFISSKLEVISMLFLEQPCCWTAVFTSLGNDILFNIGTSSNLMAKRKNFELLVTYARLRNGSAA